MKKWIDWLIAIDFWISFPVFVVALLAFLISFLDDSMLYGSSVGMAFLVIIALIPVIGIGIVLYVLFKKSRN